MDWAVYSAGTGTGNGGSNKMSQEYIGTGLEIAVIGMAARLPGAENIDEFWENLKKGVESISFLSPVELENSGTNPQILKNPNHVKCRGGILEDIEYFDAAFFNYTPGEAEIMAPPIRIYHGGIWTALEDAGYNPRNCNLSIGIYTGCSSTTNWETLTRYSSTYGDLSGIVSEYLSRGDFISTLISYKLDLKGPAFSLQTACSTSLVAIHLACQGLLAGDCDMALSGGIKISLVQSQGYIYEEGMIGSPDGHCRTFDARAKGSIGGEGVGVVVLKRLEDAVAHRDNIYALIKGSSINNDGMRKVGYTAPSIEGQAEVIVKAHQMAEIFPRDITFVETHGTGTSLGDITEVEALKIAFENCGKQFCAVGSVKTNFGHLDTAAGVTGLIKTVLALKHKQIPPSLNFETPNAEIDLENSPFYVNTRLQEWKGHQSPLRAGVSSFGIGGTNAHMVLEEWQPNNESNHYHNKQILKQTRTFKKNQLILLSANSHKALDYITTNMAGFLKKNPRVNLADVAYTLQVGRGRFPYKRKLVCSETDEAINALSALDPRKVQTLQSKEESKPVIFMFSGLGSQYINMGLGLYRSEPIFRKELDQCIDILQEIVGINIKDILYPVASEREKAVKRLNTTEISQYVIFIFEYSLARLLLSWGIVPRAMIGYSFGEYVAACLSGVFSIKDALRLLKVRGGLISQLPPGMMLSVPLPANQLKPLPDERLSIGIDNGPSCIISGPLEPVKAFARQMKKNRVLCIPLTASHGIHSQMMIPIEKEYQKEVSSVMLNPPRIPYISTLTGNWIKIEDATSPQYWAKQLSHTVCFATGIQKLLQEPGSVFLEIGPGGDISALVNREIKINSGHRVISLTRNPKKEVEDARYLTDRLGLMWLYGVPIDWTKYNDIEKKRRLSLPTYPFEKQRFWKLVDDYQAGHFNPGAIKKQNIVKNEGLPHWFYVPSWKRKENYTPFTRSPKQGRWMVFADDTGVGAGLVKQLRQNCPVIIVKPGTKYMKQKECEYTINPKRYEDYKTILGELKSIGPLPDHILHLWGITDGKKDGNDEAFVEEILGRGFYSLIYIAKALNLNLDYSGGIEINVVTNNMQDVTGEEDLCPVKASILGPCMVIPQEYPHIICRSIDIQLPLNGDGLLKELTHPGEDKVIAYRGKYRWVRDVEPVGMDSTITNSLLRKEGVYLIIGGLGTIGSILAEYLAKEFQAKLILTGRSHLPHKEMWNQFLLINDEADKEYRDIQLIQRLEELGGEVLYYQADIAMESRMREVIAMAEEGFGKINGVIHSAGLVEDHSFAPIAEITEADCNRQFQPKLYGLLVLEELFREKKIDFCLLISSIASVLGGLEFVAYSAANNFMDAFSSKYNQKNREPWIVVNWDGTNKEDTRTAFHYIFSTEIIKQIIFSRGGDLEGRISRWVQKEQGTVHNTHENEELHKKKANQADSKALYTRPELSNQYKAPGNAMERKLAEIWQNFFGIEKIGVSDDLFDLGGDSLKAMNIIAIMQKEMKVTIPIKEFFDGSTIERVAKYLIGKQREKNNEDIAIHVAEKKEFYPLSSAQKRLYVLQQLNPMSTAFNTVMVDILQGDIKGLNLDEIFKKMIIRHESLRTSIEMVEDQPAQRVQDIETINFSIKSYSCIDSKNHSFETFVKMKLKDFVRPFELSQAPLLRIGLITMANTIGNPKFILMVDMHHIVTDAVSHEIFRKELALISKGKQLPVLKIQYKDYAEWQSRSLRSPAIREQGDYWWAKFKEEIPALKLPYDYPRPQNSRSEGDSLGFKLSKELKDHLDHLVKATNTTLFMVLMAAYNILLYIYSGQEDIVVGVPITGRNNASLQNIVGFFINMLPLRNFPKGSQTFLQFLEEVKINSLEAFENQDYQFEELVKRLDLQGNLNRNPLFDTVFAFQNVEGAEIGKIVNHNGNLNKTDDLKVTSYELERKHVRFDLLLRAGESTGTMFLWLEYSTELFERSTVEQMKEHYLDILQQIGKNRDIELKNLQISHDLLATEPGILNQELLKDFEF